jgi:ribose/xylose/arabinose/galactoside ABC-type transport system permease subunit
LAVETNLKQNAMLKELGKWLMDIAKYITTVVVISSLFGRVNAIVMYSLAIFSIIITLGAGLFLINSKSGRAVEEPESPIDDEGLIENEDSINPQN